MKKSGLLVGYSCLLFLVLLGCSGQPQNTSKNSNKGFLDVQPSSKTLNFTNPQEASDFAKAIKLECQDCPNSLGLMVYNSGNSLALCNGVFINSNLFVTNLHCLPKSVRKIGSSCENGKIYRPNSDKTLNCKSVLDLSPQNADAKFNRPDFVALEIENEDQIPNIKFELKSLSQGTEVHSYISKTKSGNESQFVYEKTTCKVIHNSVVNPYANASHKATYGVKDCRFSPGDSGSPLFSAGGELVGLHSQQMIISESSEYYKLSEARRLDFARGTLAYCFYHLVNNNYKIPRECQELYSTDREVDLIYSLKKSQMLEINKQRSELVQDWIKSHTDVFFFELNQTSFSDPENRDGVVDVLEIQIECVRPKYKDKVENIAHTLDRWVTYLYYDENLSPSYKVESELIWSKVQIENPQINDQAHFSWEKEINGDTLRSSKYNRPWCEY